MSSGLIALCNDALIRVGGGRIADFEEETEEARQCRLVYPQERLSLLSDHEWTFAKKYWTLSLVSDEAYMDWSFTYLMPSDCVKPLRIQNSLSRKDPSLLPPYELVSDKENDRVLLLTNVGGAVLVYIADIDFVALFPAKFRNALMLRMASVLALSLKQNTGLSDYLRQMAETAVTWATASDANVEHQDVVSDNVFVKARG